MVKTIKKSIITIAGPPGSGKSTTARHVANMLNYQHFSSGDIFREIAKSFEVDVARLNIMAEENNNLDFEVDSKLRKMGDESSEFVIDSRTAFFWMPQSYKVYLDLDINTAAERVFKQIVSGGRVSQTATSIEDVMNDIETRIDSELKRYKKLYNLDYTKNEHYDLIINTTDSTAYEIAELIVNNFLKYHI